MPGKVGSGSRQRTGRTYQYSEFEGNFEEEGEPNGFAVNTAVMHN